MNTTETTCECGRRATVAIMVPWTGLNGESGLSPEPFCRVCARGLDERPMDTGEWTLVALVLTA